ncbi:MAG: hypothetical protein ACRD0W_09505, partial [Acidimicrobiales bacterium]
VRRLGRSTDTGDAVAMVLWADRLHGVVEVAEPRRPGDDADATPRRRGVAPRIGRARALGGRVLSPLAGDSRAYAGRSPVR